MTLKFIPVVESDRDFFIHVHHASYRPIIEQMFGWDAATQDDFANKAFDEGGMHIITHNEKKVGVVGWDQYENYLWLKELFLLPEYQNQKIGSKVLEHSINKAQAVNKDLRLQTLKENIGAKKLYERFGFEVTDKTDTHWKMIRVKN